ncbi:Atxn7l1 [Phodopus roborovskii]|uniref:Atxn7l1 protein n=1 Tax=Phodopus roborovskii TaxID=109678 RepID=A0AAU9YUC5_PHORO|nr:Atxn7l1 [Phodopus roborovskii]
MTSERSRIPCLSAAAAEGTGKKQQEGTAMATLHRKVPSPEAFLGKPWSSWIDAAKLHCSDNVDLEEAGKEGGKSREVMRLNKEEPHMVSHSSNYLPTLTENHPCGKPWLQVTFCISERCQKSSDITWL